MSKLLLIGIDGGNLELIERWKDELPTFNKLMKKGVYGKLVSAIPPSTVPCWNCLFTGKNPGKLGLYDFVMFPFYRKDGLRVANYLYQDSTSLWDILSDSGKKVQIINVPITSPPKKVNGLMVSGGLLLPLCGSTEYTYPPELREELENAINGYEILPFTDLTIPGKEEEYLKKFQRNIEKQVKAVRYLMKRYDWDFLAYVFYVTDSVQHYFWHHMDETHPKHDPRKSEKYKDAIKKIYKKVDEGIADILESSPIDTNIIVVSDHGSGPLYGYFLVNKWLEEKGLLYLRKRRFRLWRAITETVVLVKNFLLKHTSTLSEFLVGKMPKRIVRRFLMREVERRESAQLIERIEWDKTRAYGLGGDGSIFINLKGREPNGTVTIDEYETVRRDISELLHDIKDPIFGKEVLTTVYTREEIYSGKHVDVAPDILYILDGYKYVQRVGTESDRAWIDSEYGGGHSLYGIFIAYGPDIMVGGKHIQNVNIYDVTPTVLHMMNVPIPENIDGKVLFDIFHQSSESAQRSVVYQKETEKKKIIEKIKKLKFQQEI